MRLPRQHEQSQACRPTDPGRQASPAHSTRGGGPRSLTVAAVAAAILASGAAPALAQSPQSAGGAEVAASPGGPERIHQALSSSTIEKAIRAAKSQRGTPYGWGGTGPDAFDCSGLTSYAFRKAGIKGIPRTSSAQAGWAKRIPRAKMRRGDLVFFHNGGSVYHVGIFTGFDDGKRRIIHAPSTGKRVERTKIWTDSWFAGTARR